MSIVETLAAYLRPPDGRSIEQIDEEILDELQFHLEMCIDESIREGMSSEEARAHARQRFGDYSRIHKTCRRIQLGERIMLQRIQVGLTAVLLVVVMLMAVGFYLRQAQYGRSLIGLHESVESMQKGLTEVLESAPPVVVRTVPDRGDVNVDPSLTEIRATFSKKMLDGSWSWCQTDQASPETTGSVHYLDDRKTCVLPVKLEPDTEYVLSLNSEKFDNFKDQYGRSAIPYALYFTTRSAP